MKTLKEGSPTTKIPVRELRQTQFNSPFLGAQQRCPITSVLNRQHSNITKPLPWKNYWLIGRMSGLSFVIYSEKRLDWEAGSYITRLFALLIELFSFILLVYKILIICSSDLPSIQVSCHPAQVQLRMASLSTGNWLREKEFQAVLKENPDLHFHP